MLEVRRLRLLAEFATRGTVAATAEALHLTGPAVSQQLAALEKESGVPLLEKRGRTLHLTSAGQLLVDHARVLLDNLAAAESDLAALRRGERGTVRIAAFPSAARTLIPLLWPDPYAAGHQAPTLHLVEHEPEAAEAALLRHRVDIAVTHSYSLLPRPCRRAARAARSSTNPSSSFCTRPTPQRTDWPRESRPIWRGSPTPAGSCRARTPPATT